MKKFLTTFLIVLFSVGCYSIKQSIEYKHGENSTSDKIEVCTVITKNFFWTVHKECDWHYLGMIQLTEDKVIKQCEKAKKYIAVLKKYNGAINSCKYEEVEKNEETK